MFKQPLLPWKMNKYYVFWVCVCSLSHPACKAHAPYFNLWPVRLYNIFPHYLMNSTIFRKKGYWTENTCFDFLYNFCQKSSCEISMKLEFSGQIFEKYSNIIFYETSFTGSRVVSWARAGGQTGLGLYLLFAILRTLLKTLPSSIVYTTIYTF